LLNNLSISNANWSTGLICLQILQMPGRARKRFLQSPLRWHPTGLAWWDAERIAVARYSGGVAVLEADDDFENNAIGDSAEFFSTGVKISRRMDTGFFLLEVNRATAAKMGLEDNGGLSEEEEEEKEIDDDEDDEDEELGIMTRAVSFITGALRFSIFHFSHIV
jgi:hypothetical protein